MTEKKLKEIEKKILYKELKDFQLATVERCFKLFTEDGQRRVLVADEVGLGKTLIARGVIAKLAAFHKQSGDDLFKVLYICSNASIARQNIGNLITHDEVTVDYDVSDSRLSMQHLKICEQKYDHNIRDGYIQLIPLTPETSFYASGDGNVRERALIYAILKRLPEFNDCLDELREFLIQRATKGFDVCVDKMEQRIDYCNERTRGEYISDLTDELKNQRIDGRRIDELITDIKGQKKESIELLRRLFARISIGKLKPDLVIMDEFQRFRDLITAKPDTDLGMLTHAFLKKSSDENTLATNTLLLSATPYKLYQTLEEVEATEDGVDKHYKEFFEVMNFLFNDETNKRRFQELWRYFSDSLSKYAQFREDKTDFGTLINIKKNAEREMYNSGVCRTERMLVDPDGKFIKADDAKNALTISDKDILSFVEAEKVSHIPVEYVKSCPYLLSFMEKYKYKEDVHKKMGQNIKFLRSAKQVLFVDENKLKTFGELPPNNARLKKLTDVAFDEGAVRLLWIPPSLPYYEPQGVFKGKDNFSKILVFSRWAMVPRMIASMLSYECEQRTIGKLYARLPEQERLNKGYFIEDTDKKYKRFPTPILRETTGRDTLVTANELLAGFYNPVNCLSKGMTLKQIMKFIEPKVRENFDALQESYKLRGRRDRLVEVYVNMAIASPAICAYRVFGDIGLAEEFADAVANMFDKPEAIAVVKLIYGKSDNYYYENVLKYCVDGNFAAMLDEYAHILYGKNPKSLCKQMCLALKANTASYTIDTYSSFAGSRGKKRMRSHFAAGFYQTEGDEKTIQRKEHLRTAFNAPFRPFVLATTSIGQEGLDFHNYARKIMHWNLPHNPIDIEQREGRINRFKCLAIRQSLAKAYGKKEFKKDVWDELFKYALADKRDDDPELVPYWCLPDVGEENKVKIERIVPMYPYSRDKAVYGRLLKILSLYRVTLGQPRQEELLEYLLDGSGDENIEELFINLSPFRRQA
jgi:hypothetical protein